MIRALGIVVGVLLGGGAASAEAPRRGAVDGRQSVAILDVASSSPDIAHAFESSLEAQLDTDHIRLITRARAREQLRNSTRWTEGCVVGACLAEVRAQTGAAMVLLAVLTGSGTTFGYVVTLVRTDTGRVLAQASDRCDVCTESEAVRNATLATMTLVNAIPDPLPDEAAAQSAAVDVAVNAVNRQHAAAHRRGRRVGLALTLVGLAAAGAGAALFLASDERPRYGLATAAAGGGLAAGGLLVLAF